jgi:hypothetical protein
MQRFIKVPLIFLFIGSLIGVFLRLQFISPTRGTNYSFFLHGHSHIMFLGWIFNALYIGFTLNHIPENQQRSFRNLFVVLQVLVVGMLVSFPIQGYGLYSILFSTLHTFVAIAFVIKFFKETKVITSTSVWYARVALVFFLISAAGPFSLGYLMSAGLGQSNWYYFSIYFYLHFQYNGFFLFGILSLLFNLLERRHINFKVAEAKSLGILLAFTCIPTYLLSTLWANPDYFYNIAGGVGALIQMFSLIFLVRITIVNNTGLQKVFNRTSRYFLFICLLCFAAKLLLQIISALPAVAQLAYELRPVTIAYLHLVLVGVISLWLLVWFYDSKFLDQRFGQLPILFFLVAFLGMEVCLVLYPWWTKIFGPTFPSAATLTFVFSSLLSLSCLLILIAAKSKSLTKISF